MKNINSIIKKNSVPKKPCMFIPSRAFKNFSNNIDNNIDSIIENKLEEFANNPNLDSDYYSDSYRVLKNNTSSHRKAFIVEYMFTYDEPVTKATDEIMDGTSLSIYKAITEKDTWSADSVEQAILYTYQNFGKSYNFNQKYGNKKNIKFSRVMDVYVQLHCSYIPESYSNRDSTWNQQFREFYETALENNLNKEKE